MVAKLPVSAFWILDAMIADAGLPFAGMLLTRPRSTRPFTADDVRRLDQLRPWLAHAFRPTSDPNTSNHRHMFGRGGVVVLGGQLILAHNMKRLFQTQGLDTLLMIVEGETSAFSTQPWRGREILPLPVQKLVQRILSAAKGAASKPFHMQIQNAFGLLTLEAKWLAPAGTLAEDASSDPKDCLISVTIEFREHLVAHASRILRECGATPAQMKVGIQLAVGKTKPAIADELGIKLTTVADLTRKLYRTLDVHNSAELGTRIWLGRQQNAER